MKNKNKPPLPSHKLNSSSSSRNKTVLSNNSLDQTRALAVEDQIQQAGERSWWTVHTVLCLTKMMHPVLFIIRLILETGVLIIFMEMRTLCLVDPTPLQLIKVNSNNRLSEHQDLINLQN